ncbi:MAG: DUF6868 family protein [Endozoicomonas sp.]
MTIDHLTTFFGWCSVINMVVLILFSIALTTLKEAITSTHSKLFGISRDSLATMYFQYLGNYKIAIFIFNLVPYLALKLMS